MIKIEALTLEEAYHDAATTLKCSVTELAIEVVQHPKAGVLGFFKKSAIIVATIDTKMVDANKKKKPKNKDKSKDKPKEKVKEKLEKVKEVVKAKEKAPAHTMLNDTIMPASFVSDQDDEDDDLESGLSYTADYDDEFDEKEDEESSVDIDKLAKKIDKEVNELFNLTCFEIDKIEVSVYNSETLLVEFKGEDAALLIGKEGYRYKALSYMIFNWINSKYDIQLRLEIAEFLKNQEESVSRYLVNVCENINRDGRAQTKILDGVLVQIALKELREKYPQKYVVIRSTRDGLKYIIVNDYHNN